MTLSQIIGKGLAFSAAALALVGFGATAKAQTINGAGATFPEPIYRKWFAAYEAGHPGVNFNYQAVGSGAGISQYRAGTVFFGATDAPLSDSDMGTVKPTYHIPTVAGSIVMAYNIPGIGAGLRLTGDLIADIYLGRVKAWDDARIRRENPRLNLPALAISVIHRADGSGTTYIYTNYLANVSGDWRNGPGAGKSVAWPVGLGGLGNRGVAAFVQHTKGAIGYVELAYALQTKLSYGPVKNRAGNYVTANEATTTAAVESAAAKLRKDVRFSIANGAGANTYPICGVTYLLVPKHISDAKTGRAFVQFLQWAMHAGQQEAGSLEYAPLSASLVSINERSIAAIHIGR